MVLLTLSVASFVVAVALGILVWRMMRAEKLRSAARVSALAAAIEGTKPVEGGAPPIFTAPPRSPVQGRPLLKVAIGFAFAVTVIVLIAMTGDRREAEATEPVVSTSVSGSLELVSMRHQRATDSLTVTGLVRNAGQVTPDGLTAVVFAFDREGNYVASGRAPLEFPNLAPGDESPFSVSIPDVKDVGRYRVSFRTGTGVVRHVDRRPALQVSAN